MANINIYPIHSDLSVKEIVNEDSKKLIAELSEKTGYSFNIVEDLDALHDADLGLILVQTGGSENKFKELSTKIEGPYYLLTYGSSNSLAASLEILSYIHKVGKDGEILHGSLPYLSQRLKMILAEKNEGQQQNLVRLGVIGKPSDWLISSDVDYQRVRKVFGVELVDLTTQELIWDYASIAASVQEGRLKASFDKDELNKAYRVYKALKQMIKDHHLSGLTIRCFDLLGSIKTTACLGLALLNEKGITGACEGDIPAMLTTYTVEEVLNEHCFQANPAWIDTDTNMITFAHCTLPLDMASTYEFNTHFESGIGVGIHGEVKTGSVTIVKIGADLKHFYCEEGELTENEYRKDRCRTQIKIKLASPVSYFLKTPLGNHHLICSGHHKKELSEFYRSKGLNSIEE